MIILILHVCFVLITITVSEQQSFLKVSDDENANIGNVDVRNYSEQSQKDTEQDQVDIKLESGISAAIPCSNRRLNSQEAYVKVVPDALTQLSVHPANTNEYPEHEQSLQKTKAQPKLDQTYVIEEGPREASQRDLAKANILKPTEALEQKIISYTGSPTPSTPIYIGLEFTPNAPIAAFENINTKFKSHPQYSNDFHENIPTENNQHYSSITETNKSDQPEDNGSNCKHSIIEKDETSDDNLQQPRRSFSQRNNADWGRGVQPVLATSYVSAKSSISYELRDPTKGQGIVPLSSANGALMLESTLVCYACSSLVDPSCWIPNRGTTVKYCHPGHHVCVTKTYRSNSVADLIVIRDCGSACNKYSPGLDSQYNSCSVCKDDLCNSIQVENSASCFNQLNFYSVILVIAFMKYVC